MSTSTPEKLKTIASRLYLVPHCFRMIWTAARGWTIAWLVLLLVQGLLPGASLYLAKKLVDSLVAITQAQGSWEAIRPAILFAALTGAVMLLTQILQSIATLVRSAQSEYVGQFVESRIQQQASRVDLSFYESSDYYDHMSRVVATGGQQPLTLLETVGSMAQNAVTLVTVAAMLLPYAWWLPFLLFVGTAPALWALVSYNRKYHAWWVMRTQDRRRVQYFNQLLTTNFFAAEVRLFGFAERFTERFLHIRGVLCKETLRMQASQVRAHLLAGLAGLLTAAGTVAWMGSRLVSGTATLGDLALFYRAFEKGQGLMRTLMSGVGQMHSNTLLLEQLIGFLDYKPGIVGPADPSPTPARVLDAIRIEHVSFHYPGRTEPVLTDFNLELPTGKTVAIVGENGAGKTTLIKLLARFYDPTEGRITWDGVDLRALDVDDFRQRITILFQFPAFYQASVTENIALSDVRNPVDMQRVEAAARAAGIHDMIMGLPQGYDSALGTWFGEGKELSGGEWQRVAMARAFYRQAPLIILDEPTSMMDSWAEAEWFQRFRQLSAGAAALIITHRFTIARRADIIHVVRHGRIVESGSHEELIALGGLYMQSWSAQISSHNGVAEMAAV